MEQCKVLKFFPFLSLVNGDRVIVAPVGLLVPWSASRIVFAFIWTWWLNITTMDILILFLNWHCWSFSCMNKLLFLFLAEHFTISQWPTGMLWFYVRWWLWWRLSYHGMALLCSKWCCHRGGISLFSITWLPLYAPSVLSRNFLFDGSSTANASFD